MSDKIRLHAAASAAEIIADSALAINNGAFALSSARSSNDYPQANFRLVINAGTVTLGDPIANLYIVEQVNGSYPTSEGGGTPTQPGGQAYVGTFYAEATSGEQAMHLINVPLPQGTFKAILKNVSGNNWASQAATAALDIQEVQGQVGV